MFKLIQHGEVYAPEYLGKKDILVVGSQIACIEEHIEFPSHLGELEVVDALDCLIFPGFIDGHNHYIGAGGRKGPVSRARELSVETIARAGLTTIIGSLGIDNTSRDIPILVMRAKGLRSQFITAFVYTGSYVFPSPTLTGSIEKDLVLIEEIVGVKMAVGEPAASFPSEEEITRNIAEANRGGLLSGKAGVVHIHVGEVGEEWFEKLQGIFKRTHLPFSQVVLTHVNRNKEMLKKAGEYALSGGFIDLTANLPRADRPKALHIPEALSLLWEQGVPTSQITVSSDGNSIRLLPDGRLIATPINTVFEKTVETIKKGHGIEEALRPVTINPAMRCGLQERKGSLAQGKDADFIVISKDFQLMDLYSMGRCLIKRGEMLIMDYL